MFLDITASSDGRAAMYDVIARTAEACFMPLSVGGGVRAVEDARRLLRSGADKVSVNTAAVENPDLIAACADAFGVQCVVAAVDVKQVEPGRWEVFTYGGRKATGLDALDYAATAVARGAGEILLTSMDRDGVKGGYDLALLKRVQRSGAGAGNRLGWRGLGPAPGGGGARRWGVGGAGGLDLPLRRGERARGQGGHGGRGPAGEGGLRWARPWPASPRPCSAWTTP